MGPCTGPVFKGLLPCIRPRIRVPWVPLPLDLKGL